MWGKLLERGRLKPPCLLPAIIDDNTFGKVQEEIAGRNSKHKVKQKGAKTELEKYSSKYALTELLVC